jgi:stage II sporulation protein D
MISATSGTIVIRQADGRSVTASDTGTLLLQPDSGDALVSLGGITGAVRHYRGALAIECIAGRLRVVNEVPLESYLRSVVVCEMGGRAPLEALKAQAVASRTFAVTSLGRWTSEGYDVRDTVDSQVYSGADTETPAGDMAVSSTEGLVLTDENGVIPAQFCADCGGACLPVAGATSAVSDAEAHEAMPLSRRSAWTLTYTPEQFAALVRRSAGASGPGKLVNVEVDDTDPSGRVRRLRLTWQRQAAEPVIATPPVQTPLPGDSGQGTPGTTTAWTTSSTDIVGSQAPTAVLPPPVAAVSAPEMRQIAGNTLRTLIGLDILRSTLFTVHKGAHGEYIIEGHGWGHGHGMCQDGAMALAAAPLARDYSAILHHYYPGATIDHIVYREEEDASDGPTSLSYSTGALRGR